VARFGIVGIVATAVYPAVSLAIVWSGLGGAIVATVLGHLAAGVVSYFGHLRYSFKVESEHAVFLRRFLVLAFAMLGLNIGITWLSTSVLSFPPIVPIATVAVLIPVMNYLCSRFWVFYPGLTPTADKRGVES